MEMSRVMALILTLAMVFTVLAAFPMGASAASMADETFFAKLDYAANPDLNKVKAAVDKKDYDTAKAELLSYFKARHEKGEITGSGVTEADENYGMAVLPMRNILTGPYEFDIWQAEFTVENADFADYEIDVTDRIRHELANGAVSFMLMAGNKQQFPVYVKSKEAGEAVAPRLVVEFDGGSETVVADNDTYISSQNTTADNGAAEQLEVKEDGSGSNPTGTNTRRAYMNFPLTAAAGKEITSARLVVNAALAPDCSTGPKDVLVINIGDTTWDENKQTWNAIKGNIYSYEDAVDPTWGANVSNADAEYHNVTARFWYGKPMAYEYLSYLEMGEEKYNETHPYHEQYPGKDFGPKLVDLMDAFATQMSYGYNRTLETGERLNRWVDIVDALLGTPAFDDKPDEFVNILSFMWGDCNSLYEKDITNGSYWWSNWRIVANAGFFKAVEFLPELKDHDKFRDKVEYNVEYTLDLLYNDDMSFTEAGPSYAEWCVKLFTDCAIAAQKSGNPMSADFRTKLTYAARNAAQSFFPDGWDSNVGDSNYRDKMPEFRMIAEYLNDPVLNAYVNGENSAAAKDAKSVLYDDANSVSMRTSWNPQDTTYVSFVNSPADGHAHPDSNQVLMYAYGKPLLVDSGRYGYSNPNNTIYNELRYASAHNTVEAEGVSMGGSENYHSNSAKGEKISTYADNDVFTFATSTQHGYPNTRHTRNVLFLKHLGVGGTTFLTDYVDGNKADQVYRQNWHFMPSSGAAVGEGGHSVYTNFANEANVGLYNADADAAAEVKDGYFSADYGLVASSKYASFKKTGEDVKFGTVIVPYMAGRDASDADIVVTDKAADINSSAISMKIPFSRVNNEDRNIDLDYTVYVKNNANADGTFGEYKTGYEYQTDADAAFVMYGTDADEDTHVGPLQFGLVKGKTLKQGDKVLIDSPAELNSIGVEMSGLLTPGIDISGENLTPTTDKNQAIKIYCTTGTVEYVNLNGESVEFEQDEDGYVYAVGVGSVTTVVEEEYTAEKDGYERNDDNNEAAEEGNRKYVQASINDYWARNAYLGFDLGENGADDFDKAVQKMTITEAASGGNIHFYWMDYGTWTRDNLPFVVDSNRMPTRNSSSGEFNGYKGYPYRMDKSVAGLNAGDVFEVDITDSLKGYLSNGAGEINPKFNKNFTIAMISETGSTKFASIEDADNPPGPTIVLYKSKTEGEKKETKVTVKFLDNEKNEIRDAATVTSGLSDGKIYTYNAPETVEYEGKTYYLDKANSDLSVMIAEGNTYELTANYVPAAEVKIQFTHNGETVGTAESAFVMPGSSYTYTPDMVYFFNEQGYLVDAEGSTLTVKADGSSVVDVALAKADITEIPVANGSFEDGLDGWYAVGANNLVTANGDGEKSSEQKYDGEYSYKQKNNNGGTSGCNLYGQLPLSDDVKAGDQYILAFRRYGGDSLTLTAGLSDSFYDIDGTVPDSGFVDESCGGLGNSDKSAVSCNLTGLPVNQWHQLAYTLTAGANSKYAVVYARWCGGQYFDDFRLYKVDNVEVKSATVTVKYVDAEGKDVRTAETFEARVGDEYDAKSYVIESFRGNKNLYTYNAEATKDLTGTVAEDTVVNIVYDAKAYDGILLDLSFDDAETGFAGGLGKAEPQGENVLADGKSGKALSLDGTESNWLNVTAAEDGSPLLTNVEEITVSFYSQVNGTDASWPFFAASSSAAQTYQQEHYIGILDNGGLTVERYSNSGARPANIRVEGTGDGWKLVTVVYSKDKTELYVDGQLKGTQASDYSLADVLGSKSVLQIGKANWDNGEFYNGLIDEFKIYDYAMTAQDVAGLMPNKVLVYDGAKATADSPEDGVLAVAQYDKDGKLLTVETKAVKAGETAEIAVTKAEGAVRSEAFLWKSIEGMEPVTGSVSVNF